MSGVGVELFDTSAANVRLLRFSPNDKVQVLTCVEATTATNLRLSGVATFTV